MFNLNVLGDHRASVTSKDNAIKYNKLQLSVEGQHSTVNQLFTSLDTFVLLYSVALYVR